MTNSSNYQWYIDTLSNVEKVLYKSAVNFHFKYSEFATEDSAHFAGMQKISSVRSTMNEMNKPQTYVDLKTGKKFTCTESEMMARHQF